VNRTSLPTSCPMILMRAEAGCAAKVEIARELVRRAITPPFFGDFVELMSWFLKKKSLLPIYTISSLCKQLQNLLVIDTLRSQNCLHLL
jgi:hypothetical protein